MARAGVLTTSRRGLWFKLAIGFVVVAAIVSGAVIANGYSVTQTPEKNDTVWALQTSGKRYAKVNTSLGELETVKSVRSPSDLVQTASSVLLYSQSYSKVAGVDPAQPADLTSATEGFASTPSGTSSIVSTGDWVGYLTGDGKVYVSGVSAEAQPTLVGVGTQRHPVTADAIAIGTDGVLYVYSHAAGTVTRYDIASAKVIGRDTIAGGPSKAGARLTAVGDSWALLDQPGTKLWIAGRTGAIATSLDSDALLQQPSAAHGSVLVAGSDGLYAFDIGTGRRTKVSPADAVGVPAAPYWSGATAYGAWLAGPGSATSGTLWTGREQGDGPIRGTTKSLGYGGVAIPAAPQPVFRSNGSDIILNDTTNGWIWSIPEGVLVPSSQHWDLATDVQKQTTQDQGKVAPVTDPKPPVAENDSFGVRAGAIETLPVLLNDHDPNEDVLTIIPSSVTGLDPGFGKVSVTDDGQSLAVQLAPNAAGQASFQYAVTDGTSADGLNSAPATVTLTVHDPSVNSAPVWCGVEDCLQPWPSPQVAPGGTVTVPVLKGWVDPDGDPMFVYSAVVQSGAGSVSVTPEGQLVYQHPNAADEQAETVVVMVTVSDVDGAQSSRPLSIRVTPKPALTVLPFALETSAGEHLTVDPSTHITGASGTVRITAATVPETTPANIAVDSSGSSFDFEADDAGSYLVSMTVADTSSTTTSLVRITVLPKGQKLLTTSPVTVFVRPNADTGVDVFSAVSNPSGAVLLLSGITPAPAQNASLIVDSVGQAQLRVRGSTGDGLPGLLGTIGYTVSDGTGDAAMSAQGQATVYLLHDSTPQAPIAIDDAATVRAGTEIDIPVLANDVGPDGNVVDLDPSRVRVPAGNGLAFASGSVLRYLAPSHAGTVVVRYGVYTAGAPELTDSATVTITVLPDGGNRPPQPQTLTGRVLSGQSVSIPFDGYGIDPDGDSVVLDQIASQPQNGNASISATGDAIVYTSKPGFSGADQFSYEVRDSQGDTGTALVRIGVIDQHSDPTPVTFSDYAQVQTGSKNHVVVDPAANDVDPAGSPLTLVGVEPAVDQQAAAQYAALKAQIESVSSTQVVFTAPATPQTMTYSYSVRDEKGNVGVGLIVVKAVSQPIPSYPVVSDTNVSAEQRDQVPSGIDVVTGKVSWSGGDVHALKLSLWGSPRGASVSGDTIKAKVPDAGMLIAFELSGKDFAGVEVATYGFLRIPSKADVILALKAGVGPQTVPENGTVSFDMADLVAVPKGETLTVDSAEVSASGVRAQARCKASGTRISYSAGAGAPWSDACSIAVGLAGQKSTTVLSVPITVVPPNPVPVLNQAAITASPGSPAVDFALTGMTSWQSETGRSGDIGSLRYEVSYTGSLFTVVQHGQQLSVTAKDDAQPGLADTATVAIEGYPAEVQSTITLRVGPAPSTLPAGGTLEQSCSESAGSSCDFRVIGAPGEVNVYQTPLVVTAITAQTSCVGVTFSRRNASTVTASWTDSAPGASCQARFQVQDAQRRTSGSGTDGTVVLDLHGYPQAPDSAVQSGWSDDSATISVAPGAASAAYPALEGFDVFASSSSTSSPVASCTPDGSCSAITGLHNGDAPVTYTVRAKNDVGYSRAGVQVTAWAYDPPDIGDVTLSQIVSASSSSPDPTDSTATVSVVIGNVDATTRDYVIDVPGNQPVTVDAGPPGTQTAARTFTVSAPGTVVVDVTAESTQHQPTSDAPASTEKHPQLTVVGGPRLSGAPSFSTTESSITVGGIQKDANGASGATAVYFAVDPGAGASGVCSYDTSGDGGSSMTVSADHKSAGGTTISGLTGGSSYDVYACVSNGYGTRTVQLSAAGSPVAAWDEPGAPSGYVYWVCDSSLTATPTAANCQSNASAAPDLSYQGVTGDGFGSEYQLVVTGEDRIQAGVAPRLTVKLCYRTDTTLCGPSSPPLAAGSGSAPWPMALGAVSASCSASTGGLSFSGAGATAGMSYTITSFEYANPGSGGSEQVWSTAQTNSSPGAIRLGQYGTVNGFRALSYTVSWPGTGITSVYSVTAPDDQSALHC